MNFGWSLKPIFLLFTVVFGIDLENYKKKSTFALFLITFLCIFWLFCFNIPVNVLNIVIGVRNDLSINNSYIFKINFKLTLIATGTFCILLQVSVLVSAIVKWKPLWRTLHRIQYAIGDHSSFHRQLRRQIIFGILLISAVIY